MRYLLLMVVLVCECSAKPYVKLSGGHILNQTRYWNYDDDGEQIASPCDASFRGEAGLEKRVARLMVVSVAYAHNSNIDCGYPFDGFDEYHKESVEVGIKVGGD